MSFGRKTRTLKMSFAVPYFEVSDSNYRDFSVPVAIRGDVVIRIEKYERFLKRNSYTNDTVRIFEDDVKKLARAITKEAFVALIATEGMSILNVEACISSLNGLLCEKLSAALEKSFGIRNVQAYVTDIDVDKSDAGYEQLSEITRGVAYMREKAKAEAEVSKISDQKDKTREKSLLRLWRAMAFIGICASIAVVGILIMLLLT